MNGMLITVPTAKIQGAQYNPARRSDLAYCKDLLRSIKSAGQIMPGLAHKIGGSYVLIDGHRRKAVLESLGLPMSILVVDGKKSTEYYAAVNTAQKRITGADVLSVYLKDPTAVCEEDQKRLSGWTKEQLRFAAKHGASFKALKQARSLASYASADVDTTLRWLLEKKQTYRARKALESGITPAVLRRIIEGGKALKLHWEAA